MLKHFHYDNPSLMSVEWFIVPSKALVGGDVARQDHNPPIKCEYMYNRDWNGSGPWHSLNNNVKQEH